MEGLVALVLVAVAVLSMVVGLQRAGQMLTQGMIFMIRTVLIGTVRGVLLAGRSLLLIVGGVARGILSGAGRTPKILGPGNRLRLGDPKSLPTTIADYSSLAKPGELRPLHRGTLTLGRYLNPNGALGRPLALPFELLLRHCAVIGPTGSGKTESILLPWCIAALQAGQSVVLIDIKGDLYDRLQPVVRDVGAALRYVSIHDPQRSDHWNFFEEIEDDSDLERIVSSILGQPRPNDPQPYFRERDSRLLRALLLITRAYFGHDATPMRLYQMCSDQEQLRDVLSSASEIARHRSEIAELLTNSPEEFSRAVSGLSNKLHLFSIRSLATLASDSTFRLAELWERPSLLIVGARIADGEPAEVLSSCMLNMLFASICRRFDGPRSARSLFLLIDEAPRLASRIPYSQVLAIVRAAQVGVCLLAQDIVQFGDERAAHDVLANCATMILLRGCKYHTAQYFSNRLGDRLSPSISHSQQQRTWPWQESPPPTQSVHVARNPVLGVGEIMNLPMTGPRRYSALVQAEEVSSSPFLVDLTLEA